MMKTGITWDKHFMAMAIHVSTRSKDPSTKVGCVIVNQLNEVVSTGYNGFPRGVEDTEQRYNDRGFKYLTMVHAELNAIIASHIRLNGCSLYTTFRPCTICAGAIIQSGVRRVVYPSGNIPERWVDDMAHATAIMKEAGVSMEEMT